MAEENILLRVGVDLDQVSKSEQAIVKAREEVQRLKDEIPKLTERYGKNSVEIARNGAQIKNQNQIIRENERVLIASNKLQEKNDGSIKSLRESVKTLTAEYVGLTKEERENTQAGRDLQARILAQTNELKKLEKQIGNTSRNVGNYKDDVKEAIAETGLFGGAIQTYTKAKKLATIATKSFGNALIATGLGAFLVLLGSLVTFLRESEEGSKRFQVALKAVEIIFGNITSLIGDFGGKIVAFFDDPVESIKGFGQAIVDNIIKRFEGILKLIPRLAKSIELLLARKFKEAAKVAFDAVAQVVTGIENASDKIIDIGNKVSESINKANEDAEKFVKTQRELAVLINRLTVENARLNKESREQERISRDTTRSTEERIAALDRLAEIQKQQAQNLLLIASREEDLLRINIKNEGNFEKRLALEAELARATAKRIDAETALQDVALKATQTRAKLEEEIEAEKERQSEERFKNQLDAQKQFTEDIQKLLDEADQKNQELVQKKINDLKESFIEGTISFEEYQNKLSQIEAGAIATREQLLKDQLEKDKEAFDEQIEAIRNSQELSDEQKIEAELLLKDNLLDLEKEFQKELNAINQQGLDERVAAAKEAIDKEVEREKELADIKVATREMVLNAIQDIFGKESAAGKIAASFQATIDTFQAATAALKLPPPFGQIQAGVIVAQGLANVAKINSQQAPKFADGGGIEVSGPSHAGGGVDVALGGQTVANVEGGEGLFVMKKDAFQSLKALSNYNQMFGGNSWFGGGKKFLADGGAISRGSTPTIDRRMLQDTQASLSSAMQSINVVTRVTDIDRVSNEMKLVEMQGDLR